jgi:hypothetical protein
MECVECTKRDSNGFSIQFEGPLQSCPSICREYFLSIFDGYLELPPFGDGDVKLGFKSLSCDQSECLAGARQSSHSHSFLCVSFVGS